MANRAPIRYWTAIAVTQGLAALATLGGAIYFWRTSLLPLAVFVGIMVLPITFYAAVGSIALDPTKTRNAWVHTESPSFGRRLAVSTLPVIFFGVLYSIAIVCFLLADVRAYIVVTASTQGYYQIAERGLFDEAPSVRQAACSAVAEHSAESSTPALTRAMQYDDDLADCAMEAMGDGAPDVLLDYQAAGWENELMSMSSEDEPQRACRLSRRLFHADRIGLPSAIPRLMTCAIDASAPAARECCAQSLVTTLRDAPNIATLLPPPETFATSSFVERLPTYLRASTTEPTNSLEATIGFSSPSMRAWTTRAACGALPRSDHLREALTRGIIASVKSDNCEPPPYTDASARMWETACTVIAPETPAPDIPGAVCKSAQHVIIQDSMTATHLAVFRAVSKAAQPSRDAEITRAIFTYVGHIATNPKRSFERVEPFSADASLLKNMLDSVWTHDQDTMNRFLKILTDRTHLPQTHRTQ